MDRGTFKKFIEGINARTAFSGSFGFDEPMYRHTTFKVGGPADAWIRPGKEIFPAYARVLLKAARDEGIPVFILGAGANLAVSDRGIRGIVLDTGSWKGIGKRENVREGGKTPAFSVKAAAGTSVDQLVDRLAVRGLGGLEFLAGMPGSVGGAVWMNARCYDKSVSEPLLETEILDEDFNRLRVPVKSGDFSYKKSPFQTRQVLILSARFALDFRPTSDIRKEMEEYRRDRRDKGHYRFPSAGSAFKNNRDFGNPTGKIIDDLGLRGLSSGGAQVAPWHGNIIINTGGASASDIRALTGEVARRVREERGFILEPEILFVGDWDY
ncbi:MAG: UDP-N-acetylmuramate dehydrogenase [Treponema sp.]|jgi:UDP-N-acetylmuramate dehydrogenase|nr:UDP-N-acetylmuramate dehydrogenase [Treponema sp.]